MVILCLSPYNFPSLRGVQASAIPLPHVGSAASEFVLTINTTHPPLPLAGVVSENVLYTTISFFFF